MVQSSLYYNKLISRTLLLKFWVFSGTDIKNIFVSNYKLLNFLYKKKSIVDFDNLLFGIKKLIPIFKTLCAASTNILFFSSNSVYNQTLHSEISFQKASILKDWKVGTLSNFSLQGFHLFNHQNLNIQPSIVICLNFQENSLLLLESKSKNLPTIGLVNEKINSNLLDYSINLDSNYFYNLYFFTKFFFRYFFTKV